MNNQLVRSLNLKCENRKGRARIYGLRVSDTLFLINGFAVLCAILFYDYCYVHCWLGACAKENIDSYHINASIFPLSPPRTSRLLIQFYPISSTPGNIFIIIEYAASVVQYQLIFNNIASKFEPFTIVFFILSQHFLRHCLY